MKDINIGGLIAIIWIALLFFGVLAIPFMNYSEEIKSNTWKSDKHKLIYWVIFVVISLVFLGLYNFNFSKISNIFQGGSPRCNSEGDCWDSR